MYHAILASNELTRTSHSASTPEYVTYETPEPESLHSPSSAASNNSDEPSDDPGLEVEGDSIILPAAVSERAPLYDSHSPVVPQTEQAWLDVNDPLSYAQVSPTIGAGFSGMSIKTTPHSPSGLHTDMRNSYSGTLSPSPYLVQTSNASFDPNNVIPHNLGNLNGPWNFGYLPQDIRSSVSASSREPSNAGDGQYYEYSAGLPIQDNVSWANGCVMGQVMNSEAQDGSIQHASSVTDGSGHNQSGYYTTCQVRGEGHVASVSGRASVECNPIKAAVDAFRNCSPLHRAVIKGDIERVKALLKGAKTDLNPTGFGGITPLHIAAFQRNIRVINVLREHGAKLDTTTSYDQSVLFFAVCNPERLKGGDRAVNSLQALRRLPVQRTDDNTVDTINALFDCPAGWVPLLRIVDKADSEGITPLMAAVEEGFIRTARLLLQRGARPEKKDKASYPALKYAASCSSPDLVRLLLEADTRIQDRDLSHMLKLVTRTLPSAKPDNDWRSTDNRKYPTRPRDSPHCEGSSVVLGEIARVYREMGVLEKLISLAEQQEQSPRVVEYLTNIAKAKGKSTR